MCRRTNQESNHWMEGVFVDKMKIIKYKSGEPNSVSCPIDIKGSHLYHQEYKSLNLLKNTKKR